METSKSSQKAKTQILGVIPPDRAERMLTQWVNANLGSPNNDARWERLLRFYPEISSGRSAHDKDTAIQVADFLRRAWDSSSDLRRFEWFTWSAQRLYEAETVLSRHYTTPPRHPADQAKEIDQINREANEPPATVTPVEAAIFYLRHNRSRALHCPNPDCAEPYFFASKKGQKYCSLVCAKPSQRESKRRWWDEHKQQQATKLRKKKERKKR
jgi:hypothetical protein